MLCYKLLYACIKGALVCDIVGWANGAPAMAALETPLVVCASIH
ncbi:hypothetical protein CASFOL_017873 [Castilleja foliolosa]|uniref:Uncharacterized protein n=1 Tax=Castilleja foliolosa TaxID=1961234 RepID=A0ABD3D919_9LAMI